MLHKSFKSAKCKTSLKLASSRIKLMRNKKGVQINQMKKELAQLLETGQDRTARIRVEHVIREEKMVAAYDLVEIYCELIVARMPIIESQKTCPIDLKEAVTSVIFAAPRCSDISELADIRKQFTAKYGKEFVSAALELRPDSGVSRMLVEKLSAVAPDIQTKVKVLTAVAKEHNINWEPTSFEEKESKPPNDLLNGPTTFEHASMENANPSKIQPPNINAVHNHEKKPDPPLDFAEQNRKYVVDNGVGTSSSGRVSERTESRGGEGGQNWNMGFKDATSAAEAAAESAERAAMAARAAAKFASHEKIPSRDETHRVSAPSGSFGEDRYRDSYEGTSGDRKPKIINQQMGRSEHERKDNERVHEANTRSGKSKLFKESKTESESGKKESSSGDRKPKIVNQQKDRNEHGQKDTERSNEVNTRTSRLDSSKESKTELQSSQKGGFGSENVNFFAEETSRKQPSVHSSISGDEVDDERFNEVNTRTSRLDSSKEFKTELQSSQKGGFGSGNVNFFAEETSRKQPSVHSSTSGDEIDDEVVSDDREVGKRSVVGNPFAVVDQRNLFSESTKSKSDLDERKDDEVIFDDDDDDDGGPKFDTGFEYDEVEVTPYLQSPGRETSTQSLENAHVWSPRRNEGIRIEQTSSRSHLFSESMSFGKHSVKSVETSETDDHVPASFDHSDGPDSESESEFNGNKKSTSNVHDIFSTNPEPSRKSRIELNDLVEEKSSFYDPEVEEKRQPSPQSSSLILGKHELKKHELDQESYDTHQDNEDYLNQYNHLDTGKDLKFGTLTGGLRNKGVGLRYPPYTKTTATDALNLSKKPVEESSITKDEISIQSSLDSRVSRMVDKKPSVSVSSSESDSDDHGDKFPIQSSNNRSRFSPPAAFFGDDDDETTSDKEVSKQVSSSARLRSELSRRTRGAPSVRSSKSRVDPEPKTVISTSSEDRKHSWKSHVDEIPAQPRSYARKTSEVGSIEVPPKPRKETPSEPRVNHSVNTKQEAVKMMSEPKMPTRGPTLRDSDESGKTKSGKTADLGSEKMAVKKPSYVHPKLPDYDTFAARLQSLRDEHK